MKHASLASGVVIAVLLAAPAALATDVSLSNSNADRIAYVASDRTIYLWNGKPVAYLEGGDDVYGFNGRHLGWFVGGNIKNHVGHTVCTSKMSASGALVPLKGARQPVPAKVARETAPSRPQFFPIFDDLACRNLLDEGR